MVARTRLCCPHLIKIAGSDCDVPRRSASAISLIVLSPAAVSSSSPAERQFSMTTSCSRKSSQSMRAVDSGSSIIGRNSFQRPKKTLRPCRTIASSASAPGHQQERHVHDQPDRTRLEIFADAEILGAPRRGLDARSGDDEGRRYFRQLSGGSTPRRLYQLLAGPPYRDNFPWSRTHWFWGDERFVPHDDTLSNYRMVREALLSHAPIPAANIHPIPTEGVTPDEAASAYERELKSSTARSTWTRHGRSST